MFRNYKGANEEKMIYYNPFGEYRLTQPFKPTKHFGIDIVPKDLSKSWDVLSLGWGVVDRILTVKDGNAGGNIVVIKSNLYDKTDIKYMHLETINVVVGQEVKKGTIIGKMGKTTFGKYAIKNMGAHLHLEIWNNGRAIDPLVNIKWI